MKELALLWLMQAGKILKFELQLSQYNHAYKELVSSVTIEYGRLFNPLSYKGIKLPSIAILEQKYLHKVNSETYAYFGNWHALYDERVSKNLVFSISSARFVFIADECFKFNNW